MKATSPSHLAASSVTAMEVEFGLALDAVRSRKLAPVMRALLSTVTILPYELEDARATATLRAALQKKGRPIGAYDALTARAALARGLVLVTANEREFVRVGGPSIENWRAG